MGFAPHLVFRSDSFLKCEFGDFGLVFLIWVLWEVAFFIEFFWWNAFVLVFADVGLLCTCFLWSNSFRKMQLEDSGLDFFMWVLYSVEFCRRNDFELVFFFL